MERRNCRRTPLGGSRYRKAVGRWAIVTLAAERPGPNVLPVRFQVEQQVDAPIEATFGVISDPSLRCRWQSSLRRVEIRTPEALGVGTRWRETTKLGPTFDMEVTRHEPFSCWAEKTQGTLAHGHLTVHFRQLGRASTLLTVEVDIQFRGAFTVLAPVVRLLLPFALKTDLLRAGTLATAV